MVYVKPSTFMNENSNKMKIAIPIWADRVSPVFDEACKLMLVEIENNRIMNREVFRIANDSLASKAFFLKDNSVNLILCGAVSNAYIRNLLENEIEVIPWLTGSVEEIIAAFLKGVLFENNEFLMPGCCMRHRNRARIKQKIRQHNI